MNRPSSAAAVKGTVLNQWATSVVSARQFEYVPVQRRSVSQGLKQGIQLTDSECFLMQVCCLTVLEKVAVGAFLVTQLKCVKSQGLLHLVMERLYL